MTALDYVVLAIVAFSVLIGIARGFVSEFLALGSWIAAFCVARSFAVPLAPLMPADIVNVSLRFLASFVVLFVLTLLAAKLIAILVVKLVSGKEGLGLADRGLGAAFGVARGGLIVMVGVVISGLTALPRLPVWRNAMLSAPLEVAAAKVKPWLPADLARHIRYD